MFCITVFWPGYFGTEGHITYAYFLTELRIFFQVESVHRSVISYVGYKVCVLPKSVHRRVALAIGVRNDGVKQTIITLHKELHIPRLSRKSVKRLGLFREYFRNSQIHGAPRILISIVTRYDEMMIPLYLVCCFTFTYIR